MLKCSTHRLNSFPDRRTLSWISKQSPALLPLSALRFLLQSFATFLMLLIISGFRREYVIPSFAILLIIELICRVLRYSTDAMCINLRLAYLSQMAERRTRTVSERREDILTSQRMNDYQQQNGGPVINGFKLFEESVARAVSALTAVAFLIIFSRSMSLLFLIPFLIVVSLFSFVFERADRKAQSALDESMKLLAVNNRKGDYYFTLLSSEFGAMKSIRSYDVNDFVSSKYAAFMDPMIKVFRRDGDVRFRISLAEIVLTLVLSALASVIVSMPFNALTSIFAVFTLVSFFLTVFRKGHEAEVNNGRMKELIEYLKEKSNEDVIFRHESPDAFTLENVSYSYPDSTPKAVDDVTLSFGSGKIYTIVGENGSGKSTLIKLMLGILRPDSGSVSSSVEGIIPYCPQKGSVLSFTAGENIALSSSCEEGKVAELLDEVELSDRISPSTKLGIDYSPSGMELSGGMAQRLITARALYFSDGILVMDEPTAALDIFAERELYELVRNSDRIDTCIFVSHRLTSSLYSDRIIVMEKGRVAEEGTYEDLMAQNGVYRALYEAQSRHYRDATLL